MLYMVTENRMVSVEAGTVLERRENGNPEKLATLEESLLSRAAISGIRICIMDPSDQLMLKTPVRAALLGLECLTRFLCPCPRSTTQTLEQ